MPTRGIAPDSLADFVHASVAFRLHRWQAENLCPILERLRYERGLRILLHAPPQFGKSILVSQRLPAYLLGHMPTHRIGLACYNETHAANFGAIVRDICASAEYRCMFPESVIDKNVAAGEFSTRPRKSLRDGQPSFLAMGLLSGFVGHGVDTLLVDDPYKSAADAFSEAINGGVWRWWSQTAKPRIGDEANVVVMFHRYGIDDFGGKLLREGGWEYFRFPAIADDNTDHADPTRLGMPGGWRDAGELLSPMRSGEWLESQRTADPFTFSGQFQGLPIPDTGGMFRAGKIDIAEARPVGLTRLTRAWDIAATPRGGDYTAGVLMGRDADGRFWLIDCILLQGSPEEVDAAILQAAATDGRDVAIRIVQDPGSAGKRDAVGLVKKLAGYPARIVAVSGPKESRARPLAAQVNVGNVSAVASTRRVESGPYAGRTSMDALLIMLQNFPMAGAKKDGVDAAADAFNEMMATRHHGFS